MFLETLFLLLKWYKERSSRTQSCSFPSLSSEDSGKENDTEATNEFCTSEHFQPPAQKACSDCYNASLGTSLSIAAAIPS